MWPFVVAAVIFFAGWFFHLLESQLGDRPIGIGFILFGLGFVAIGLAIRRPKP